MAFDPQLHIIDPQTGFMVHKDTGHMIGIEQAPVHSEITEFPKWVPVHPSRLNGGVAPEFADTFHARDGAVTVLVNNADEEALAATEKEPSAPSDDAGVEPYNGEARVDDPVGEAPQTPLGGM